MLLLRNKE